MSKSKKPSKSYADFPLYAHAAGVWAKKIRGKVHYFGSWSDLDGALESFLAQRDYLMTGRTPPAAKRTVANLLDNFMDDKQTLKETGDITETTFNEYESICELIHNHFGKRRNVDGLTIEDFRKLRTSLCKSNLSASRTSCIAPG